ncbi:MAG: hypothetical protein LBJ02_07025 [Bifidobacteriaceae bacterium]|nr:hypothetical protein [Bifidobacteriaceae bacterium]
MGLLLGLGGTAALATQKTVNNGQLYYYTTSSIHSAEYFNLYYSHRAWVKTSATGSKGYYGPCKKASGPSSYIAAAKGLALGRDQSGFILC